MFQNVAELIPVIAAISVIVGGMAFAFGYFFKDYRARKEMKIAEASAEQILAEAKAKQREITLEARDAALKIRAAAEVEIRDRRADLQRQERRLQQKEENLDRKVEAIERRERAIGQKEKETDNVRNEIEQIKRDQVRELERVSGLSISQAKELLLKAIEDEVREDAARRIREIEAGAKEEADRRARQIIAMSIQRWASDQVAETTVSVVPLPSDEMKGRIIGREGRNIRALESATGVDLIIDDTPDAVTLSGFDPVRREIARLALGKLVLDGRIHPARIEEVVQKAKQEVDVTIKEEGEQAAIEAGVPGLHPELIKLLGRMKYRTSYGQNVLMHSVEVAQLAAMMAAEIGADVQIARVAGLLHDLGKAVDHDVEGPHALIGADLAKRFGKSAKIVHAIASHHGEQEPQTVEALLVQAADAISGARPGARRESLENYIKRLEALEGVANSFAGVEKSFAIQAGREVRIIVKPEEINDVGAVRLARDIVKKIEESLEYPGQIKVTVVRETRAVDYAK
ncbi:MAG: ribonuclease Y [Chloroflexi bacterium]|nr:ribonuclease Y [Chloroflexota bacterium]